MKRLQTAVITAFSMLAAAGCGDGAPGEELSTVAPSELASVEQHASVNDGKNLFAKEKFDGNGRTCTTCHSLATGTVSPADIATRPSWDAIFEELDSDDGVGSSYTLLKRDATVRVTIPLPANIRLATSSARSVTLRRGIPTTLDAPKLDTMLMMDGRATSLENQASGAILGHAQARRTPTPDQLASIALYEKTLFTSTAMRDFATNGGPMPALPAGTTASEQRGRAFFEPTALCGSCHGGVLLNRTTAFNPLGLPPDFQFATALVSDINLIGNPVLEYIVTNPDSTETHVTTPDPGMMLTDGNAGSANLFKMLSLRNLRNTAPYFHDNSAKTIADVMVQYDILMNILGVPHTQQDLTDIAAYMQLL
jgi:cytochrome c peroxidase